jgi:hypothetical protein
MVKRRAEPENATGNASSPNVFFRQGQSASWRRVMMASQLMTERIC